MVVIRLSKALWRRKKQTWKLINTKLCPPSNDILAILIIWEFLSQNALNSELRPLPTECLKMMKTYCYAHRIWTLYPLKWENAPSHTVLVCPVCQRLNLPLRLVPQQKNAHLEFGEHSFLLLCTWRIGLTVRGEQVVDKTVVTGCQQWDQISRDVIL